MRVGWRSRTKGLISAIYSPEKVWFSCRWGRAGVSLNGLLWWNISPLFGLRDPLNVKPASSNHFVSVERLSVAKRLLSWQISGSWGSDKARKTAGVCKTWNAPAHPRNSPEQPRNTPGTSHNTPEHPRNSKEHPRNTNNSGQRSDSSRID